MDCSSLSRDRLLDHWLGRTAGGDQAAAHLRACPACKSRLEEVANACSRLRISPGGTPAAVDARIHEALEALALDRAARRAPMESIALLRGEWLLGLAFALLLILLGFLVWPWSRQAERASERKRPMPALKKPMKVPMDATIRERTRPGAPNSSAPERPESEGR